MSAAIRIVCATRESADGFVKNTALGRSLQLYRWPFIELRLFPNNSAGLSAVYNTVLRESVGPPAILLFIHDDIHLLAFFCAKRLVAFLNSFDIQFLAGNNERLPRQPD